MMNELSNLEKIRKEKGFSRLELSKLSGVAPQTIQKLEQGLYNVNMVKLGTLVALSDAVHAGNAAAVINLVFLKVDALRLAVPGT